MPEKLILCSGSERREKILRRIGVKFDVVIPEVEEVLLNSAASSALENARTKCAWGSSRFPDCYILAADTVVSIDGHILGKPSDANQGEEFLRILSDRTHWVHTAVVMAPPRTSHRPVRSKVVESQVTFRKLDDSQIRRYVATVRPLDRAGAYDIDKSGNLLIASWTGSYTNIMGLPEELVRQWLSEERLLP